MNSTRLERVQRQILREAYEIVTEEVKDPRIGFITMTHAELSPDLRQAKIFVSAFGNPSQQDETWDALASAAEFVRSRLWKKMQLRISPEITFVRDQSVEYADRISRILDKIKASSPKSLERKGKK